MVLLVRPWPVNDGCPRSECGQLVCVSPDIAFVAGDTDKTEPSYLLPYVLCSRCRSRSLIGPADLIIYCSRARCELVYWLEAQLCRFRIRVPFSSITGLHWLLNSTTNESRMEVSLGSTSFGLQTPLATGDHGSPMMFEVLLNNRWLKSKSTPLPIKHFGG